MIVLLSSAQKHDVLMAARIDPTLVTWRDSRQILAMESPLHLEAIKARLARQSHLATLVHMLSRCESCRAKSNKVPSWYLSHNAKHGDDQMGFVNKGGSRVFEDPSASASCEQ